MKVVSVGFLFLLFGIICLFGNLIFIPIILLNLQRFRVIKNFSRFLVRISWNFFLKCTEIFGYQSSNYHILQNLNGLNSMIICNHPSLLDVVFFLAKVKNANCVVKKELKKNIF